jgi:hypothetical protein
MNFVGTQEKKVCRPYQLACSCAPKEKKIACSCTHREFKDNVINYAVCLVVVLYPSSFPSFHFERLAELETETMLVFSTRKAQEKEKLSRKVSPGSVFTTQANAFSISSVSCHEDPFHELKVSYRPTSV